MKKRHVSTPIKVITVIVVILAGLVIIVSVMMVIADIGIKAIS